MPTALVVKSYEGEFEMQKQRPPFNPAPVKLSSEQVLIRPLTVEDAQGFYLAGQAKELWQWVFPNRCESLDRAKSWIEESLAFQDKGLHVPFVIVDRASGKIIGSTRYCSIRPADRNIEIGFTFISPEFQRTHVNTQAKYLLLKNAFENLGAIRVELRTHEKNRKSRNAILRIGAKFEAVLRNSRILPDGSIRNTALFSITEQEWPEVKAELESKIHQQYQVPA